MKKHLFTILLIAVLVLPAINCSYDNKELQNDGTLQTVEMNGSTNYHKFSNKEKAMVRENLQKTEFEGYYYGGKKIWDITSGKFFTDVNTGLKTFLQINHPGKGPDFRGFSCQLIFNDDSGVVELEIKGKGKGTIIFNNNDKTMPDECLIKSNNDTKICVFLDLKRIKK